MKIRILILLPVILLTGAAAFAQDDVATRVGKARSTVTNTLRLLDLAP